MLTLLLLTACDDPAAANTAPEVEITEPGDGDRFHEGEPFTVVAEIADDQGASGLVLSWAVEPDPEVTPNEFRSDRETSLYFGDGLPLGSYTISLLAVDGYQEATKREITVAIRENDPPVVRIEEPQDGASYAAGESIGVSVTVRKLDDDMSNITLTWGGVAEGYPGAPDRPNADGAAIFYIDGLERGKKELSVTASDGVNSDTAAVSFRVSN